MKSVTLASLALMAAATIAADSLICFSDTSDAQTVDSDTSDCTYTIPSDYPPEFTVVSSDSHIAVVYYFQVQGANYWNDVPNKGNTIEIPDKTLIDQEIQLMLVEILSDSTNSTSAMRKRFESSLHARADINSPETLALAVYANSGIPDRVFSVNLGASAIIPLPSDFTSIANSTTTNTITTTSATTTLVTITSCSKDVCSATAAAAT